MNNTDITKIIELAKWGLLTYLVVTAVALVPVQSAYADQNGEICAEIVFDIGLPKLEPGVALQREYDKKKLFEATLGSIDSGRALFDLNGFEIEELDGGDLKADNSFSSEEDMGGLGTEVSDYEPGTLEAGDILKAVPSISTEDKKTLGILVPPFAYFSKKF